MARIVDKMFVFGVDVVAAVDGAVAVAIVVEIALVGALELLAESLEEPKALRLSLNEASP